MKKLLCILLSTIVVSAFAAVPESHSIIMTRNIFNKNRKPNVKESKIVDDKPKTDVAEVALPDYVLVGVFVENGLAKAFIEQPKVKKFSIKELNESIENYTLTSITTNQVTLMKNGEPVSWNIGFSATKSEDKLSFAEYTAAKTAAPKVVKKSAKKGGKQSLIERMKARRKKKKNKKNKKNKKRKSRD